MAKLLNLEIAGNGVRNAVNHIDLLLVAHEGFVRYLREAISDIESQTGDTFGLLATERNLTTFWEHLSQQRDNLEDLVDRIESVEERSHVQ